MKLTFNLAVAVLLPSISIGGNSPLCNQRSNKPPPDNGLPTCSLSVADFPSGRPIPGTAIRDTSFPPWLNVTLARKGQAFAMQNLFCSAITAIVGLIIGLPIPDELEIIAFTGKSDTQQKAMRRYFATVAQLQVWGETLFTSRETDNAILVSIQRVRQHHISAATRANLVRKRRPLVPPGKYDDVVIDDLMWDAIAADFHDSNLTTRSWPSRYNKYNESATAVNQFVMGLILLGYSGTIVSDPKSVYIWNSSEEDLQAFMHVWAVSGWLLGIEDDYNVFLQPDPVTARKYFKELHEQYIYPAWFNIDKTGKVHVEALLNHFNKFIPGLGLRPIMYRVLKDYVGLGAKNTFSVLSRADKRVMKRFERRYAGMTRSRAVRNVLNAVTAGAVDIGVLGIFGNYVGNMDKATHVFYPKIQ